MPQQPKLPMPGGISLFLRRMSFLLPGLFLCYSLVLAQTPANTGSTCDSMVVPPIDGTIHARYFDKDTRQEKEMILLFSEGVLKEMTLDGSPVPSAKWSVYDEFVQGIQQDYEDSNKELCEAEIELQRAEEEMKKAREEMNNQEVHVVIDGAGIVLAEARRSLEELDRMHGDEVRREIEHARMEIRRAADEFKREDLPEIHQELGRLLDHVQDALRDLEESQQDRYTGHPHHQPDMKNQDPGKKPDKNMESTLEELENKK
ncbi:MAG: hypothetical protein U0T82_14050 [Bacteroidales bacterium]